ncbi:piggyBac transposable element-derived protein 3-like [Drosophila gunungcola]|uniref:piggyBac transposable element-derived protein 3-like n=1 Tax=Drosophila gunungcola TaxID=103775 RepID=UPI0022E7EDEF|nr:piggyBac transposable element-derived protein 3-like [Drosophila gunungcola]XP_052855099.1 piggyBac transposable element-derived protein 3-like [Drosophila gunungcola]
MRPKEKGLSNDDIERIVNFDWDVSSDEESGDEMEDISGMLENNLKSILERGESIEFEHIENLIDEKSIQENSVVADNCFEKVDPKTLKWRNRPFQAPGCIWEEDSNRQIDEVKTPVEYFCSFFDNNVIDLITNQTNLYGLQEHGIELQCTGDQIKRYIGILLYLGVIKVPQFKMAWSKEYKLSAISDAMPRGKFEKIKQCLHFNDNTKQLKKGDLNYDKLYKIRPLLDILKKSFGKLPQEEHQSVDEQIIAYKGQSSYKQYNPAKPHKWGLKMCTRAGTSGLVYDFTLYVGEGTCPNFGLGISSDVVLYLSKGLPKGKPFKLYFDNWFTSVSLLVALKENGIFATGTIRKNRISSCRLLSDAELKKRGRGSFDTKYEVNNNLICVKWFDNKSVQLLSSYEDHQPVGMCKRWSPKEKVYIDVVRPAIVGSYNKGMGGVDLADMLMELYKINHRSRKWYIRIFYWCLGTSMTNAWLLYRKNFHFLNPNQKYIPLIKFQMEVAHELLQCTYSTSFEKKRGRPSNMQRENSIISLGSPTSSVSSNQSKKYKFQPNPTNSMRYDCMEHWVVFTEKGRCRLCKTGTPMSKCIKCKVHLCCNNNKNCFMSYHT